MTRLIYFRFFVLICIITNTSPDCFARNPLFEHAKSDTVKIFNIKDYGAVGDGKTTDTESIDLARH